ncbi:MAG: biotin/lipoyl-binding protein [Deltaproteobacteria bacterium]|nr:biotin/lipoyl-binding protein [Deltaproteobacteria bacterium]
MIFEANFGERTLRIDVNQTNGLYLIHIEGHGTFEVDAKFFDSSLSLIIHGASHFAAIDVQNHALYTVNLDGRQLSFDLLSEAKALRHFLKSTRPQGSTVIEAKMPGKIVKILAKVGDSVQIDEGVLIMEAMKMENELRSPINGKIKEMKVSEGQAVEAGAILVVLEQ